MPRNPAPREGTLDKAARELVLARDSIGCAAGMGRCQVCRKIMPHKELEASHHVGRRKRSVRWDADNLSCKCHACHRQMDLNPLEHAEWVKEWLGEERYAALHQTPTDHGLPSHPHHRHQSVAVPHLADPVQDLIVRDLVIRVIRIALLVEIAMGAAQVASLAISVGIRNIPSKML